MKKNIFVLAFIFSFICSAQSNKNVYFIGNSYTASNNLPQLIKQIAIASGDNLTYSSHTPGGTTIRQHASNQSVLNTIAQGTWDFVVLQEQSQIPAFPSSYLNNNLYPYAEQLVQHIKNSNYCTVPVFYMTWGRENGDQQNCNNGLTNLCTYEGMDDAIYNTYMNLASQNNSLVSPVGRVWRHIRENSPEINLYISDGSHPSYIGSVAAAFTFYSIIYKKDPTLNNFQGNLSQSHASYLKQVVKQVVFDNLDDWFVGENDNPTDFTFTSISENTFQFNAIDNDATTFTWNFGDGNTSNLTSPTHTYSTTGNYIVQLITNACNSETSKSKTIEINNLSNNIFNSTPLKAYPNPASNSVYIDSDSELKFKIFNTLGKKIEIESSKIQNGYQINTKNLKSGIYILEISDSKNTIKQKVIIQ